MADKIRTAELDWDDFRYAVELARHRSLSATARALRVNHATVSRRLARLEATLGAELFDRHPDGYLPTSVGEAILADAAAMESASRAARARVDRSPGLAGTVRISATRLLADFYLVDRLGGLSRRHDTLDIEIVTDSRNVSLARREADIAVRMARPREGDTLARRLGGLGYGLYASSGYRRRLVDGSAAERFIAFDTDGDALPESVWLARIAEGKRIAFRSNSQAAQLAACRAGFGLAVLPHILAARDPGLVSVAVDAPPLQREIWLLMRRELARVPRVRGVADALAEIFSRDRRWLADPP
jgi:DNA-binding transcriptional LysR family regulator